MTVFADRSKAEQGPLVERDDAHNLNLVFQKKIGYLEYGVFHSKLMLIEFDDRLRVVISSSNLYVHDWEHMSQVIWLQDFFPKGAEESKLENDFEEYLTLFLKHTTPLRNPSEVFR